MMAHAIQELFLQARYLINHALNNLCGAPLFAIVQIVLAQLLKQIWYVHFILQKFDPNDTNTIVTTNSPSEILRGQPLTLARLGHHAPVSLGCVSPLDGGVAG